MRDGPSGKGLLPATLGANVDFADFGRYLSQQRELRGLSREDVARATRIPSAIISALEDGQVEKLPARVFVINYIKAYARVIGLSADEAVLRYEEVDMTTQATLPVAALERERRRRAIIRLALVLAGVVVIGALALVLSGYWPVVDAR